jgi:hypothetical protein
MNRTVRLRVAVSRADAKQLRSTIVALNRQDLGGLHPAERSALRALRSSRNPARSILQPHYGPALQPVAEVLTHDCLEATRQALGEAADEPTLEQLRDAVAAVRTRFAAATVGLMLAATAATDAPAADFCDQLLDEDEELGLRGIEDPGGPPGDPGAPARPPSGPPKRRPTRSTPQKQSQASHKPWKTGKDAARSEGAGSTAAPSAATTKGKVGVSRRSASLPARYSNTFDPADPLSGTVVIADVQFASDDPSDRPVGAKLRPCVVVAGSPTSLLVRAGYTGRFHAESWRSTALTHWRQAGLEKPTHIEADLKEVERAGTEVIGRLTEEDWNSLW